MSVVIEEVIQEGPGEAVLDGEMPANQRQAPPGDQAPDIFATGFEMRRMQHRLDRLWAD